MLLLNCCYAICGRSGNVAMFLNVVQDAPDAAQEVVPRVNPAVKLGAARTIVYAIGTKSSGSTGNCGARMKAPTVVVTPVSVGVTAP